MGTILASNSLIPPEQLQWLSCFPAPFKVLHSHFQEYRSTTTMVRDFLSRYAHYWVCLSSEHEKLGYPILVDEMLVIFRLHSRVLQAVIFRAFRRTCGFPDAPVGSQMDSMFNEDQARHCGPSGVFQARAESAFHLEPLNQVVIQRFQVLIRHSLTTYAADVRQQQRFNKPPQSLAECDFIREPTTVSPSSDKAQDFTNQQAVRHWDFSWPFQLLARGSTTGSPLAQNIASPSSQVHHRGHAQIQFGGDASPAIHSYARTPPHHHKPAFATLMPAGVTTAEAMLSTAGEHSSQNTGLRQHDTQPYFPQMSTPEDLLGQEVQLHVRQGPLPQVQQQSATSDQQQRSTGGPSTTALTPQRDTLRDSECHTQTPIICMSDHYGNNSVAGTSHCLTIQSLKQDSEGNFRPANHERHYQYVKHLALRPHAILPGRRLETNFDLASEDYARIAKDTAMAHHAQPQSPANLFSDGSICVRLRCILMEYDIHEVPEDQWVTRNTMWPEQIQIRLNNHNLRHHYDKNQAIDVGHYMNDGFNTLQLFVAATEFGSSMMKPFIGVEVVETLSHCSVLALSNLANSSAILPEETLTTIKHRLGGFESIEEDDITLIVSDLTINLADPFSFRLFNIPVRGKQCTHLECFDLETWLHTRPNSKSCLCGAIEMRCVCPKEHLFVGNWKCPICSGDARPHMLRIDGFLSGVRATLVANSNIDTKEITVSSNGSWKPKISPSAETNCERDEDGKIAAGQSIRPRRASKLLRHMNAIEVISLDDN